MVSFLPPWDHNVNQDLLTVGTYGVYFFGISCTIFLSMYFFLRWSHVICFFLPLGCMRFYVSGWHVCRFSMEDGFSVNNLSGSQPFRKMSKWFYRSYICNMIYLRLEQMFNSSTNIVIIRRSKTVIRWQHGKPDFLRMLTNTYVLAYINDDHFHYVFNFVNKVSNW